MVFKRRRSRNNEAMQTSEKSLGKIRIVEGGAFAGIQTGDPVSVFVVSNKFIQFGQATNGLFSLREYHWDGPKYTTKEVTTSQRVGGSNTLKRAAVGKMVGGRRGAMLGAATSRPGKVVQQTHQEQVEEPALATAVIVNKDTKEVATIRFLCSTRENQGWSKIEREVGSPATASPTQEEANPAAGSVADELVKFKELLDQGIITQEEFDHKKKVLLGM